MVLQIKAPILGFESLQSVVMKEIDELFSSLHTTNDSDISFTVANPYLLIKDYEFDIPDSIKMKLEIEEGSEIGVYCMVVTQEPLENSIVNFLAPLIINKDKKLLAQVVLNAKEYPDYSMQEPLSTYTS